jgi:hypothetical protein
MDYQIENLTTCDNCGRLYNGSVRQYYCSHCDKYFYICPSCALAGAHCKYCAIALKHSVERNKKPVLRY